ncbi:hypothetical protein [Streptosporangium sp. NPDC006930]|uniref:hypothetical protein n=1 Tax=unclassified Streptosporangium TaxID=2632669 RepID=UPI0034492CCA
MRRSGFVRQFRPQLFAADDRTSDPAEAMLASSDRTQPPRERMSLTSANTLPLVDANAPELVTAVTSREQNHTLPMPDARGPVIEHVGHRSYVAKF